MPRILIADDHPMFRAGVIRALSEGIPGCVFGEAGTGAEVLEMCSEKHWDLLVLDMTMPVLSGLEVMSRLTALPKRPRVLVLSMHPEFAYAKRVLRLGGMGYVTKDRPPEELVLAARKILAGRRHVSAAMAESLAGDLDSAQGAAAHESLSDREFQVLRMIASGQKTSEIAAELDLSPKTVSTFRARIFEKMQMKNNSELVTYCRHHGLLE